MEILGLLSAVITGILVVLLIKPKADVVSLLLTFSGAYLLSITVLKLLPEVYTSSQGANIGLYIILGLLIQLILDFFSKGAEHGHVHALHNGVFPWALFISLNLHAFMEGLPLSDHHHNELLWAIIIHKIPITMVLASLFLHYEKNKKNALFFLLIFAFMTPLGTILGDKLPFFIHYRNYINAVVAGAFLHIATIILFENSKEHHFNVMKFTALLLGILVAVFV